MKATPPYGTDGCRCTSEEGDHGYTIWYPLAHCPRHGVLAEYTPPRMDTGTYQVLRPGWVETRNDTGEPEAVARPVELVKPPYDPGAMIDGPPVEPVHCSTPCRANPMDCPGPAEDGTCLAPTTEKERGVLATVRRWWRRFGDWLDPHAAHEREHAEFQRLWLGQWRSGLDGGEPGPPGQQPRER